MNYPGEEKTAGLGVISQPGGQPNSAPMLSAPFAPGRSETPPPATMPSITGTRPRRRSGFLVLAIIVLAVLAGGTLLTVGLRNRQTGSGNNNGPLAANASGQVTFFDGTNGTGGTDALRITVNGLNAASAGFHYDAWLVDEANEGTTPLGSLSAQGNTFTLNYSGNGSNGQAGSNLLSLGNVVEVTQEQGNVQLPTGKVLLSATFPPKAFVHIKHLLFSFPTTPGKIGLLVGLLNQTKLLNGQALALQSIASGQNANAADITCAAQSIIDISEGLEGSHYKPLPATCGAVPTGDGFGILGAGGYNGIGYAPTAATHASLAATQSDSTANIRLHASEVEVGTTDIINWVTTIDKDAVALLTNPQNQAGISQIVTLSDNAYHGVNSNGSGQIQPINGEEGASTAYLRGQLMATLPLQIPVI